MTSALLLLLLDSRSPAGAHNHSAGMEVAITAGWVRTVADVEDFCRGRLRTSGRVAAAFAATAWSFANAAAGVCGDAAGADTACLPAASPHTAGAAALEAEFEARTPSPAVRAASLATGRGLTRLVRAMLPAFDPPWRHHPLVLGAATAAAGGTPELAARAAALGAVTMPASAAVRLLGLDPFAVQDVLARIAPDIDEIAACASLSSLRPNSDAEFGHSELREAVGDALPAYAAPAIDLLADVHLTAEVRLFAS